MTLRWGHWQPRDDDPELDRLWERLLDRLCPQPLVAVQQDGRVTFDDCWLHELEIEELEDGLRRATLRRMLEDRRRAWLDSLIATLSKQIADAHATTARQKAAPARLQWGPDEVLEVAPPYPSKPPIPAFSGPKGRRR